MGQFKDKGFVCRDDLEFVGMPETIGLCGEISCIGNILITVDKTMAVFPADDDVEVKTLTYNYNASVRGHGNFLRHDNSHSHTGHPDEYHWHAFDWRTGEALSPPQHCGEEGWPNLGEFIQMVEEWYWAHREELPCPDECAVLGLR